MPIDSFPKTVFLSTYVGTMDFAKTIYVSSLYGHFVNYRESKPINQCREILLFLTKVARNVIHHCD